MNAQRWSQQMQGLWVLLRLTVRLASLKREQRADRGGDNGAWLGFQRRLLEAGRLVCVLKRARPRRH